jgi:hypothetical protein
VSPTDQFEIAKRGDLGGPPAPAAATAGRRDAGLDALRGAAIILMIVDHVLVLAMATRGYTEWMALVRMSLTRFSMPLFMIVSGLLLARKGLPSTRRLVQVAMAAIALNLAFLSIDVGFAAPEILAVWLLVLLFYRLIVRYPIEAAVLGILQTMNWPVSWAGYQPGTIMAFLALGVVLSRFPESAVLRSGDYLPGFCSAIGRRPLSWYTIHLGLLWGVGVYLAYQ